MKVCIFGGQYGSEGKGAVSEFWSGSCRDHKHLIAAGENSPNSGHTCSKGKTRNIPACSFFATEVLLGPDSVIDLQALAEDILAINTFQQRVVPIYIHEHAAFLRQEHIDAERGNYGVVQRISSTGSGSGAARSDKYIERLDGAVIGSPFNAGLLQTFIESGSVRLLTRSQYLAYISHNAIVDWIFECSQGVLLDTCWGIYPFVTSRSTLPRVAIARNVLDRLKWTYAGVYRTYPIRTGGPSGPTGGKELSFEELGVQREIATVTKRTRRIFEWSLDDFMLSCMMSRPDIFYITHLDYLPHEDLTQWLDDSGAGNEIGKLPVYGSTQAGIFNQRRIL